MKAEIENVPLRIFLLDQLSAWNKLSFAKVFYHAIRALLNFLPSSLSHDY